MKCYMCIHCTVTVIFLMHVLGNVHIVCVVTVAVQNNVFFVLVNMVVVYDVISVELYMPSAVEISGPGCSKP